MGRGNPVLRLVYKFKYDFNLNTGSPRSEAPRDDVGLPHLRVRYVNFYILYIFIDRYLFHLYRQF